MIYFPRTVGHGSPSPIRKVPQETTNPRRGRFWTFLWHDLDAAYSAQSPRAASPSSRWQSPAAPALAAPGDPTITLPINDSEAGGTYDQEFTRVYENTTPDGTPVYIYVPAGTPLDGSAPTGVASLDPSFDHDPGDAFTPCVDADAADFALTQGQIDYMGDQLANHIVAIDEEHFGTMDAADPGEPASDSLVMVVYNVQDEAYYDCPQTTYTAGYFAPDSIDSSGMNVIVIDALDWANRVGPNDSPWRDDDPANDRPTLYEGVIAHELEHLLHNYSDAGELSWVDEGLADFAVFLNGYDVGGSHLTNHQVFYADTSLTRWGGSLANYGAAYTFFQYLWEQAGANGDGTYTPDGQYDGAGGDLLIKLVFENQADGMDGVEAAIDQFNAQTGAELRGVATIFQDWAVAVYLDDEQSSRWDIKAADFGNPASTRWTMDIADDTFWDGRGSNQGAQPASKWSKRKNGQSPVAVPRHPDRALPQSRPHRQGCSRRRGHLSRAAAHRGHPLVRRVREPGRQRARRRRRGRPDVLRLLDLALHRGGLGLRLRGGAGRRRLGERAARERRGHRGHDERRPARQQH